QGKIT
ncbi:DDE_Tnp_1-associated family protein, partial [Escherichia coli 8.0569]